jgi:hypothetical protein
MKLRNRVHTVAWLGLIAMWLLVFAPLLSQLLVSAQAGTPLGIICSASAGPQTGSPHPVSSDSLNACGYCNLLAHHAPLPTVPASPPTAQLVLAVALVAPHSTFIPYAVFPSGRPRDPPLVS